MHESRSAHQVSDRLAAFGRRWRIFVPVALATPLVALALTASTRATYESSAEVLIDRKGQAISGLRDLDWYYYDASRALNTQVELARLPDVERRVVEAAKKEGLNASGLWGRSTVTEDGVTDLMTFRVRDGDPETAAQLATIYAREYVAHRRAIDTTALRRARAVLSAQLARARAQGVDPATYAHLAEKQQQIQTGLAALSANTRLVRPGVGATRVAPLVLNETLLAVALGLVVGLGLAALASLLDARARSADEISEQLGLPLLGRIPLERGGGQRTSSAEALHLYEDSIVAEPMEMLRANLELVLDDGPALVMVTSSVPNEGTTRTAAQLAVALARAGRDVVLVDLDLRRPSVARAFDVPKAPGIVELARGRTTREQAAHAVAFSEKASDGSIPGDTQPVSHGRLRVVPAGNTLTADSESITASPGLRTALDSLKQDAEVVLVDAPPLLRSGDALTLSSQVDALLLLAHTHRYRRHFARELTRLLAQSPARPLGLVVVGERREVEAVRAWPGVRPKLETDVRVLT